MAGESNNIKINLNNPEALYCHGQIIEGHVSICLNEPMKMRGIRLRFLGEADVHWFETSELTRDRMVDRTTGTRYYSSGEIYIDNMLVLYGKAPGAGGDNPVHPAGQYTYPFQFQLPYGIPSSFEGSVGRVRYKIEGIIDRPWKVDLKTISAFTVIHPVDLNVEPMALSVPQGQNSKTLCCLCCKSGPIEATCRLDRFGYVPGENITINAEISNGSRRNISYSYAQLIQVVMFHAERKSMPDWKVVAQLNHPDTIPPGESGSWSSERLQIPPVSPSRLDGCGIIDIRYVLKFYVIPSGPANRLEITLDLLIGSIPHQAVLQNRNPGVILPAGLYSSMGGATSPSLPEPTD